METSGPLWWTVRRAIRTSSARRASRWSAQRVDRPSEANTSSAGRREAGVVGDDAGARPPPRPVGGAASLVSRVNPLVVEALVFELGVIGLTRPKVSGTVGSGNTQGRKS